MPLRGGYDRYSTLDYMEHGLLGTSYDLIAERIVFHVVTLKIFQISVHDNAKTLSLIFCNKDSNFLHFVDEFFAEAFVLLLFLLYLPKYLRFKQVLRWLYFAGSVRKVGSLSSLTSVT